ncbi:hypothetical protein [Jatrophihabitans fulvus]
MTGYPATLTNKSWQKNKGLLAKAKPTGIGEALTALEKAYAGSGFSVDPAKLGSETADPKAFEKKFDAYTKTLEAHAKKLNAAAAGEVGKRTTAAEKTFAKDKAVLTELGKLQKELIDFGKALEPNGRITKELKAQVLAAFAKAIRANRAYDQVVTKRLGSSTENHRQTVIKELRELWDTPTVAKVHELWGSDGSARTLRTTPILWDQVLRKEFPVTTAAILNGSANTKYRMSLDWVEDVGDEPGSKASKRITKMMEQMDETTAVRKMCKEYLASVREYTQFCSDIDTLESLLRKYSA